jgi:hypothetical protein
MQTVAHVEKSSLRSFGRTPRIGMAGDASSRSLHSPSVAGAPSESVEMTVSCGCPCSHASRTPRSVKTKWLLQPQVARVTHHPALRENQNREEPALSVVGTGHPLVLGGTERPGYPVSSVRSRRLRSVVSTKPEGAQATKGAWRDPENASPATPIRGVLRELPHVAKCWLGILFRDRFWEELHENTLEKQTSSGSFLIKDFWAIHT